MDIRQFRTYAMLKNVRAFRMRHGGDFTRGSNATKRFEDNEAFIVKIEELREGMRENQDELQEATPGLNPILKNAVANVRLLDAPVNNKYAGNPVVLTEWEGASHIEFAVPSHPTTPPAASAP